MALRASKRPQARRRFPGGDDRRLPRRAPSRHGRGRRTYLRRPELGSTADGRIWLWRPLAPRAAEKLAIKWAVTRKRVTLVLAKADFDRNGRAAPFRANDELIALEPVCVPTPAEHTGFWCEAKAMQPLWSGPEPRSEGG